MKGQPTDVTIHKLDANGHEVWTYRGRLLRDDPRSVTLEAVYERADVDFHGLLLRHGDRFIESFYADRGFNVFAVHDVDSGRLKGWYCNITRPARLEDGHVWAEDLALDLVVLPDGTMHVLDQDEFERLDLTRADRAAARHSMEELRHLVQERAGPFAINTNVIPSAPEGRDTCACA